MRMILRREDGVRVEAVLLAANDQRMRVAVDSADDATTLTRTDDYWRAEDGTVIEIEALLTLEGTGVSTLPSIERPRVRTAAHRIEDLWE